MLIFLDTEMTDLCADRKLISIGIVSEDGSREFYSELIGTYQSSDCSEWVRENVLPHLQGGDALMTMRELALRLLDWTKDFGEVQFATDSITYDWPWIELIWAELGAYCIESSPVWEDMKNSPSRLANVGRPSNVDGKPFELQQTTAFQFALVAVGSGLRSHHALDDAKANRLAWLATGQKRDCMKC